MPSNSSEAKETRRRLIEALNEDLSREYQAIIAYVTYSQVLKGAEYMSIAAELEKHALEELQHAILIAKQIDYLGGAPSVTPLSVKTSSSPKAMLRFDLENESETIRNYRERVRQCEEIGEFAMAEVIRGILVNEQEHQIDLAQALGIEVPNMSAEDPRRYPTDLGGGGMILRDTGATKPPTAQREAKPPVPEREERRPATQVKGKASVPAKPLGARNLPRSARGGRR